MMAVQVRIEDLHHPEGGHARIVFTGVGRVMAEWMVIRRFEHQDNYLSPEGWRGPETHVAPLEIEDVPGGVALTVGPDITEWLEYGERIEISLVDTTYRAIALWPEIGGFVGQRRRTGRTVIGAAASARPPAPPRAPSTPTQGQATVVPGMHAPAPALQATVFAARPVPAPPPAPPAPPPLFPPAPAPPPPAPSKPPPQAAPPPVAPSTRRNSLIAALVLLLIVGAGGGYYGYTHWFRPDDASPPTPPGPTPVPPGSAPVDLASLVNRPPEEVFRMAETLYSQGSYGIAFSLYDDASRRGHGPAHTRIASFYDPATFEQGKPFQRPNPRRALAHYDAAIAAGDDNARAPRDALVARLRELARGNDQAARDAQAVLRDLRL